MILSMVISATCLAQEESDKSKSKTIEFMSQGSSLIKKEFYDLGKVKGIGCQVLIVTNLLNDAKLGCLRLETKYQGYSSSETSAGAHSSSNLTPSTKMFTFVTSRFVMLSTVFLTAS